MTDYDSRPETREHINRVQSFIWEAIDNLERRARYHDRTKLEEPELSGFNEATPRLATLEYGTPEYQASLDALRPTLEHHFAHNDHHPEHYVDGVRGMSLLSLLEMLCDWRAASERTKKRADGDVYLKKSFEEGLEYNQKRFGYSDELAAILRNTAYEMGMI